MLIRVEEIWLNFCLNVIERDKSFLEHQSVTPGSCSPTIGGVVG